MYRNTRIGSESILALHCVMTSTNVKVTQYMIGDLVSYCETSIIQFATNDKYSFVKAACLYNTVFMLINCKIY